MLHILNIALDMPNRHRSVGKQKFLFLNSEFFTSARRAFTTLEVLLVIGIVAGMAGVALPAYRDYQIRNDLALATEQVSQALGRAQLLSQAGQLETAWGFSVPHKTLFAGAAYADRAAEFDELYLFPDTIATSGLEEVSFARMTGLPSATGTIILTSLRGDRRTVEIMIDRQGIAVNTSDRITVCHCNQGRPRTLSLPDAAWPAHQAHGDYLGPCRQPNPSLYCNGKK